MRIQAALEQFLLQLEADGRSPHTIGQYQRHGAALATWLESRGVTNVADLTPELVARFFADDSAKSSCRGGAKKAVSLNAMRTSIRCWCAHLHDAGLVASNPARMLRRARCAPPPPKALRDDERQRLLAVLGSAKGAEAGRDRMLIELLLGTGIRIGSALALDVEDVDLGHGDLTLRKAKNDRPSTAVLPRAVATKLRGFIGTRTSGPLLLANERRVSMRHMQRRLAHWLAAAGIAGKSAHSFRHTFATTLLARTHDVRVVQMALNHASIVSTQVYATVDSARLRAAVGI